MPKRSLDTEISEAQSRVDALRRKMNEAEEELFKLEMRHKKDQGVSDDKLVEFLAQHYGDCTASVDRDVLTISDLGHNSSWDDFKTMDLYQDTYALKDLEPDVDYDGLDSGPLYRFKLVRRSNGVVAV